VANRLYTEDDVRRLADGTELVLGAGEIATPAALDLAFQRGIHVRWSDEPASPPRPSASWSDVLGRDGTYVVLVRAGCARVFHLTDAGPVALSSS